MSAENYATCPQCLANEFAARDRAQELAKKAYGRVDVEKYRVMLAQSEQPIEIGETLAEYRRFGFDGTGRFSCRYRAQCTRCGFEFEFAHESRESAIQLPKVPKVSKSDH